MKAELLIDDLISRTKANLNAAINLNELPAEILNTRNHTGSWSVLECIEHLNLYGDYYLQEIGSRINKSKYPAEAIFKPGLLGNYFAMMMLPGKGKKNENV